jgi:dienelactone hydrolase
LKPGSNFDLVKWIGNHTQAQTRPFLDKVIDALKGQGIQTLGATGYCFGGRYVFDLAFDNIIKAAVVSHPSLLQVPADLEKYLASSKAPLLINSCPIDQLFPLESSNKADELFGDGKFAPGYKREFWEGCTHGFAVRGDMTNPQVKAGKEGAFRAAVNWFNAKL